MKSKIQFCMVIVLTGMMIGSGAVMSMKASAAPPGLPFAESFNTDTTDVTDGSYPDFTLNAGTASVNGGELQLDGGGGLFLQRFTHAGFSGDLSITGKMKAATFGGWTAGMEFGNRRFVFHPGFPGGAFRIEDAALAFPGGIIVGNTNMGFNPSVTAFHKMKLEWDSSANTVTITVRDGDCIGGPFIYVWTPDGGFDPTGAIGFTSQNGGPAFFDNLTVNELSSPLPDPACPSAPVVDIPGPPVNPIFTNDNTPTFAFSVTGSPVSVQCSLIAGLITLTTAPCPSMSYTPTGSLVDGVYVLQVVATDAAGHSGEDTHVFTVDALPPVVTITSGPTGTTNDSTPTFGFTVSAGGSPVNTECRVDASPWVPCASSFTTSPLADGPHLFSVRGTDAAENVGAASRSFIVSTDSDGDGVPDSTDNCPTTANADQANLDGDALGDACDPDDDNDGVLDGDDSCAAGSIGWTSNGATDNDHDGCRDSGEDLDDDNDGDPDGADNCPLAPNASQIDSDHDGIGDVCDPDDDNDGVFDGSDNCPFTYNPSQANLDGDAFGDACDPDDDGDGDPDVADNCPFTFNPNQSDIDHDGIGDVCDPINDLDLDNDGIPNGVDNCPTTANTDQADGDGDGIGNACDPNPNDGPTGDLDGDGTVNNADNCPTTPNADQRDTNGDGVGDLCTPFDYATGGQFVIGNLVDMSSTSNVYFWGSQWRQNNPMSGGAAPSAFKGFENGLALPACGSTWTSRPGNSTPPPATVPGNMAVIVSSSITKSGSTISGNVKKIVVVQTNPGYGPAPGHTGTGKVIAILCESP